MFLQTGGVTLNEEDIAVSNVRIDLTCGKNNPLDRYKKRRYLVIVYKHCMYLEGTNIFLWLSVHLLIPRINFFQVKLCLYYCYHFNHHFTAGYCRFKIKWMYEMKNGERSFVTACGVSLVNTSNCVCQLPPSNMNFSFITLH